MYVLCTYVVQYSTEEKGDFCLRFARDEQVKCVRSVLVRTTYRREVMQYGRPSKDFPELSMHFRISYRMLR